MKTYVSHKIVRAAEIVRIASLNDGSGQYRIAFAPEYDEPPMLIPLVDYEALTRRYAPKPGDFVIIYPDGYRSISPRDAFIGGYTEIDGGLTSFPTTADIEVAMDDGESVRVHLPGTLTVKDRKVVGFKAGPWSYVLTDVSLTPKP